MSHSIKCGIYQILCRASGKSYVGSSKSIYGRWRQHRLLLRRNENGCTRLQHAWNKHGEEAFYFSVLEECEFSLLTEREQYYVDRLRPEYNVIKTLNGTRFDITECPRGHEYTEENAYIDANGSRICRTCNAQRVSAIYATETPEEREKRRAAVKASHERNRVARVAKQREYAVAHKAEKAAYDRQHRAEQTARKREAIRNQTPEEHTFHLKQKRIAYHRSKGRGDVDTWERPPISEEQKAKISATLTGRNLRPRNEPWIAEGISKTQWYRRVKQQTETLEQREVRRAKKLAYYHANGDKEREKMRLRYRRRSSAEHDVRGIRGQDPRDHQ